MDEARTAFEVEIVYALADRQIVQRFDVAAGTTVEQALERSGYLARFPELTANRLDLGIYGKRVDPSTVLREFDRIEIYRPLIADPKQARRARTKKKKPAR